MQRSHSIIQSGRGKYFLGVCSIFRNEAEYLEEWLRFYDLIGVEHFYLYNNASTDGFAAVLDPWKSAGRVTLHDITVPTPQLPAYVHCLQQYREQCTWIAFVDLDEFLFSPIEPDLRRFLQGFESQSAVAVNWAMFGASGHQQKPPGLTTLNYTMRAELDLCTFEAGLLKDPRLAPNDPASYYPICAHVKSIVKSQEVVSVHSPHHFTYKNGCLAVSASGQPVKWAFSDKVEIDSLRINHYVSRSWQEFARKLKRGRADAALPYDAAKMIERNKSFDQVRDTTIFPLAQKVREATESGKSPLPLTR